MRHQEAHSPPGKESGLPARLRRSEGQFGCGGLNPYNESVQHTCNRVKWIFTDLKGSHMQGLTLQQIGGRARAAVQRQEAIDKYNANPNRCGYCKQPIPLKSDKQPAATRRLKFCNKSCAAKANNPAHTLTRSGRYRRVPRNCIDCDAVIQRGATRCRRCWNLKRRQDHAQNTTKERLAATRAGYSSARAAIRTHAAQVYQENNGPRLCKVCGYSLYVEVCHIRPVATFPASAPLSEINAFNNLVALCPNHHWEFDNGHIKLTQL